MERTCIDILNDTLSAFTPDERTIVAETLAKQIKMSSYPPIHRADLMLTESCNCRCTYCFEEEKPSSKMSPDILEKAVDFVFKESRDAREVAFVLFGGEPLLQFDLVKRAVEYAERKASELGKKAHFEMTTNGTLLSEEIIDFGVEHSLSYLLSLDGD